jgi:hypothetical protein
MGYEADIKEALIGARITTEFGGNLKEQKIIFHNCHSISG